MSFLAPVFNVTYSCVHDFLSGKLSIRAEGEISDELNDPHFEHDPHWLGGLKFNLITSRKAEVGNPVQRHFVAKPYEERIDLNPRLVTILIETATGIQRVKIERIYFTSDLSSKVESLKVADTGKPVETAVDVLPPKDIYLPGGCTTRISALLPQQPEVGIWPKSKINAKFDAEYIEIVNAEATSETAHQCGITYYVKWKQMSDVPTVFQVITTTWNGEQGIDTDTRRIIQPYIIHFVYFGPGPEKK